VSDVTNAQPLPCPHCGESMVLRTDPDATHWEHKGDPKQSKCPHNCMELWDDEDVKQWNKRSCHTIVTLKKQLELCQKRLYRSNHALEKYTSNAMSH